jgi:beta-phosphoglucomutase-like phosphatase (HAD superfamily)
MVDMSFEKERGYQKEFTPHLKLIKGLDVFFANAQKAEIPMAIGSAAILFNIDFVLDGLDLRHYFSTIVSADDVAISKPNPETFIKCANGLNAPYPDCIVFEDSPKGVESALKAGMKAVVIKTYHQVHEFDHLPNVLFFIDDYTDDRLHSLLE